MEYITLEGIPAKGSRLVYGTAPQMAGEDREAAYACLDIAWEAGFRTFDTAHAYGNSEKHIGEWLAKTGRRDQVVLFDKGCNPCENGFEDVFSAQTIRSQVSQSLDLLQTDCLDFYVLHRDDISRPVDEIVEVLNELKAKGKIRRFGGSNWRMERLQAANAYADTHHLTGFTACSPSYSLAVYHRDPWGASVTLSGPENEAFRSWLRETGTPVFPYSSLARGYLSGKYRTDSGRKIEDCLGWGTIQEYHCPENAARLARAEQMAAETERTVSQIALAWLLHQDLNLYPIVRASDLSHARQLTEAPDIALTDEQADWLLNGEKNGQAV